jgi:hypothetical protein
MELNKLCISVIFAIPVIPSMQAQGFTFDLPMTTINETNSSNNTVEDATATHNISRIFFGR